MKAAICLFSVLSFASAPLQAAKNRSDGVQTLDDLNHRFADKFYQILALMDQEGTYTAKTDAQLASYKQQLDDHEVRMELLESYALGDSTSCDCVAIAQLRAEFQSYQKNESARLAIASAVGGCIAAAVGGVVYWLKK